MNAVRTISICYDNMMWYDFYLLVAPTTVKTCGKNEYQCKNMFKCIEKTKICDKNPDCPGGDDEASCCTLPRLFYTELIW